MFHQIDDINWKRVAVYMAAVIVVWVGLESVVPEPWHDKIGLALAAISGGIGVLIKGSNS